MSDAQQPINKVRLIIQVDPDDGTIQLGMIQADTYSSSSSDDVCTLKLDELPKKYKKFFAKYLLLK